VALVFSCAAHLSEINVALENPSAKTLFIVWNPLFGEAIIKVF
jgi:hypothetical protein